MLIMNILKNFTLGILIAFSVNIAAQDKIPPMNQQIVKYVESVIGTQVDRGECWDLAYQALTLVNAKWDMKFKYGRLLDPKKDKIFPGDIIQFKNVMVEYVSTDGLERTRESMGQHTAIVYKVNAKGDFELAHQNTGFSGRKVGVSRFVIDNIKRGKIFIYRPEK